MSKKYEIAKKKKIEEYEKSIKVATSLEGLFANLYPSIIDLLACLRGKGEIVIITYFLNSDTCKAKVYDPIIKNVIQDTQILDAPFEIWDGYSHLNNFFIGVSIYESDPKASEVDGLIALIRGILELEINDQYNFDNESGAKLLDIEQNFEKKLNEHMADFGFPSPYIGKFLQPIEKFRIFFDWNDFNSAAVVTRPRELENAKVVIQGYGYKDFYRSYRRKADNSGYSLTKDNGNYYEEVFNNTTGKYETGNTPIPDTVLIKADNGDLVTCGGHFNWFNFKLSEVVIKDIKETILQDWQEFKFSNI